MTKHEPDRSLRVLEAIEAYIAANGYPPTIRELMPIVGLASTSGVDMHLRRLERDGLISRDPTRSRAIRVLRDKDAA